MNTCVHCKAVLSGRQRKFCSRRCKNSDTNNRHQSYLAQQRRGHVRKVKLVKQKGSKCQRCGYRKNYAALEFHHKDENLKKFQLDLRSLSNRSWKRIEQESEKCELLCSNCHKEVHHPGSSNE